MSFKTTLIASMLRPIIDLEFKKLTLLQIHFEKYWQKTFKQFLYCFLFWALSY